MRLRRVSHHLGGPADERSPEDRLAQGRSMCARTEVVRRTADDDLDLAGCVGREQLIGHRGPRRGLRRGRVRRHRLHQPPTPGRTVGVEVVQDDEPGASAGGTREDTPLERRELLAPAVVVHRVQAEVDDVRTGADTGGEFGVAGIPADDGRARECAATVPVHGDDIVAGGDELHDERVADLAGTEDDVTHQELFSVRERVWRRTGRTAVRRVTVIAPEAPKTVNWSST